MSGFFQKGFGLKPRNNIFEKIRGHPVEPETGTAITTHNNVKLNTREKNDYTSGAFPSSSHTRGDLKLISEEDCCSDHSHDSIVPKVHTVYGSHAAATKKTFNNDPVANSECDSDSDGIEITDIKDVSVEGIYKDGANGSILGDDNSINDTSMFSYSHEVLLDAFTNTQRMCSALKNEVDKYKLETVNLKQELQTNKDEFIKLKNKSLKMVDNLKSLENLSSKSTHEREERDSRYGSLQREYLHLKNQLNTLSGKTGELTKFSHDMENRNKILQKENLVKVVELETLKREIVDKDTEFHARFEQKMVNGQSEFAAFEAKWGENVVAILARLNDSGAKIGENLVETKNHLIGLIGDHFNKFGIESKESLAKSSVSIVSKIDELKQSQKSAHEGVTKLLVETNAVVETSSDTMINYLNGNVVLRNEKLHEIYMDHFSKISDKMGNQTENFIERLNVLDLKLVEYDKIKEIIEKRIQVMKENHELVTQCENYKCLELEYLNQIERFKNEEKQINERCQYLEKQIQCKDEIFTKNVNERQDKIKNLENQQRSQIKINEILETENKNLKLDIATWSCEDCLKNSGLKDQIFHMDEVLKKNDTEKFEMQEKIFNLQNTLENLKKEDMCGTESEVDDTTENDDGKIEKIEEKNKILGKEKRNTTKIFVIDGRRPTSSTLSDFEVVSSSTGSNMEQHQIATNTMKLPLNEPSSSSSSSSLLKSHIILKKNNNSNTNTKRKNDDNDMELNFNDTSTSFNKQLKNLLSTAHRYKTTAATTTTTTKIPISSNKKNNNNTNKKANISKRYKKSIKNNKDVL